MKIRNTFIIFIVSGFWHGANWTFIIWGALNALYFLPLLLAKKNRVNLGIVAEGRMLPSLREAFAMLSTFALTVLAWIFFRADNLTHAKEYISGIFSSTLFAIPEVQPLFLFGLIALFLLIEWFGRDKEFALAKIAESWSKPWRYGIYYAILLAVLWCGGKEQEFIYFQF